MPLLVIATRPRTQPEQFPPPLEVGPWCRESGSPSFQMSMSANHGKSLFPAVSLSVAT